MAKRNTIGGLRHLLVIQHQIKTPDGVGGVTSEWAVFERQWGYIEPRSASQVKFSESLEHRVTHKIIMRYLQGIDTSMRISYDNRIFQIKGIKNIEESDRRLELDCEEGAAS